MPKQITVYIFPELEEKYVSVAERCGMVRSLPVQLFIRAFNREGKMPFEPVPFNYKEHCEKSQKHYVHLCVQDAPRLKFKEACKKSQISMNAAIISFMETFAQIERLPFIVAADEVLYAIPKARLPGENPKAGSE